MEDFQASNCNSYSMFCGDIYSSSLGYMCSLLNITGVQKLNKHPNYRRWLFYTSKSLPIVTTFKSISDKIYCSPVLCDIVRESYKNDFTPSFQ
jgi:UDP-N-acetylmuramyl pentapeptide phosphotransferase/UDP-N-acetylglucosamine-1-phosphate transferase